jgi:hypothetical protein
MSESDNPWIDAVPAWVSLADLLPSVERWLGIPPDRAAEPLRLALETLEIHTTVIDWRDTSAAGRACAERLVEDAWIGSPGRHAVSHYGWIHVDWHAFAGCDIKVRWRQVVRALAPVSAEGAGNDRRAGSACSTDGWEVAEARLGRVLDRGGAVRVGKRFVVRRRANEGAASHGAVVGGAHERSAP